MDLIIKISTQPLGALLLFPLPGEMIEMQNCLTSQGHTISGGTKPDLKGRDTRMFS